MQKSSHHEIVDFLKQRGWRYHGCGYWIDPVTKSKYLTDSAFAQESKRNSTVVEECVQSERQKI